MAASARPRIRGSDPRSRGGARRHASARSTTKGEARRDASSSIAHAFDQAASWCSPPRRPCQRRHTLWRKASDRSGGGSPAALIQPYSARAQTKAGPSPRSGSRPGGTVSTQTGRTTRIAAAAKLGRARQRLVTANARTARAPAMAPAFGRTRKSSPLAAPRANAGHARAGGSRSAATIGRSSAAVRASDMTVVAESGSRKKSIEHRIEDGAACERRPAAEKYADTGDREPEERHLDDDDPARDRVRSRSDGSRAKECDPAGLGRMRRRRRRRRRNDADAVTGPGQVDLAVGPENDRSLKAGQR